MNLAFDLGPRVVVIEPGRISDDDQAPGMQLVERSEGRIELGFRAGL